MPVEMDEEGGGRRRSTRVKKLVKQNVRDPDDFEDLEEVRRTTKKKRITKSSSNTVSVKKTVEIEKSDGSEGVSGTSEVVSVDVEQESEVLTEKVVKSVKRVKKSAKKSGRSMEKVIESVEKGSESVEKGGESVDKSDYAKVKDTIRAFNKHYLHFIQEEELRVQNIVKEAKDKEGDAKAEVAVKSPPKVTKKKGKGAKDAPKAAKSKKVVAKAEGELPVKRPSKRPDLKAITKMMETNTILYPNKRPGHLPGIDVGHQFYSRAEMVVVGFHNHWLNGIDFMGAKFKKLPEFRHITFPIAISIVLSGQYEDDLDHCNDVVYTGQGGNDLLGNKSQIADQVMKRGNLALRNNIGQNVPVRVIRGLKCASSYCGKVYTYDGLYTVSDYWAEKGVSGFTIYKYRLKRLPGQPPLTTCQVEFTRASAPKSFADIRGLVCKDISGGLESIPIVATNVVDKEPKAPQGVTYITTPQTSASVKMPTNGVGCKCKGACVDPRICACAKLNGSDFPYVAKDGGRLIEPKDVVYECGAHCGCGPECVNRTSQRGIKYRLEVFRTPSKGWGVKSWDFIPSGAFVCEYIAVIKRADEVHDPENFYIFDIDCLQTMKELGGRQRRHGGVSTNPSALLEKAGEEDKASEEDEVDYCIDAGTIGNVTRYINHSCSPNLFVQCVLSDHHDAKLARIVLFAADNIPPLQELSYDYGYAEDSVEDKDGNVIHMDCYCGAPDCKKRMF